MFYLPLLFTEKRLFYNLPSPTLRSDEKINSHLMTNNLKKPTLHEDQYLHLIKNKNFSTLRSEKFSFELGFTSTKTVNLSMLQSNEEMNNKFPLVLRTLEYIPINGKRSCSACGR
jgi:hypothetical protein